MRPGVVEALCAAALFGASTPLAKLTLGELPPVLLAGLLYLGSGAGLAVVRGLRDRGWRAPGLARGDWRWLAGAIVAGGVVAPVAMMAGLARTNAASAALLLNLEAVLTAAIAWLAFREAAGRTALLGVALIVAGGVALGWPGTPAEPGGTGDWSGAAAIAFACLCWAIDNNFTRKIAAADAVFIAAAKGGVAGAINVSLALLLHAPPAAGAAPMLGAMAIGLFGYGLSLVLFVRALRLIGAARTGACFATAPFAGALVALVLLDEPASPALLPAAALMAAGAALLLTERRAAV